MDDIVRTISREETHGPVPQICTLSNGRYHTFLTAAGTGRSSYGHLALTRWSADRTEDAEGYFIYIQDLGTGRWWSAGRQPGGDGADAYEACFRLERAEIARTDGDIETRMEVCVAPDDDAELRRITLTNRGRETRRLAVTSYAEVVLQDAVADGAHPGFSKLFVQTEMVPTLGALLARRRPRSANEETAWLVHSLVGPGGPDAFETDRMRFLGRGNSAASPAALRPGGALSGTTGNVLDPIVSLQRVVEIAPGASAEVTFLLGAAGGRDEAAALADRFATKAASDRAFEAALERARGETDRMELEPRHVRYFQRLASALLYDHPGLRVPQEMLRQAAGPSDAVRRTLVVVRVADSDEVKGLGTMLSAYAFWRSRGLDAELIIFNDAFDLAEELEAEIGAAIALSPASVFAGVDGPIVVLHSDRVTSEEQIAIQASARIFVRAGELPDPDVPWLPPRSESRVESPYRPATLVAGDLAPEPLRFDNGYGGFSDDGSEYVIRMPVEADGTLRRPPLPWINVIANEEFGFLISEQGAGYTWSLNSRQNQLTPWKNDPVRDPHGEALYIRDEESGIFWSPLPGPVAAGPYEVRHGFGYTSFRHLSHDLLQEARLFVPRHDPVRILRLRLTNRSDRTRKLTLFQYQQWVLGDSRFVITEYDEASRSILATNRMNGDFAGRIAFAAPIPPRRSGTIGYTGDRDGFLGRYGSASDPAALRREGPLDGRTGAGLDPCAAFNVPIEIGPGEVIECAFLLGEAATLEQVRSLVTRYRSTQGLSAALEEVVLFWKQMVSGVQVETPSEAVDLMVNGWLPYQNVSCRMWGRSAFYQSGGAFGFRDQLQDASALLFLQPEMTRAQILLHAAHQFTEGDVLHWWHPPSSRGIRTRFSDDLLWLPYMTSFYVSGTGDAAILDEEVRFLEGRPLAEGEDEVYMLPEESGETAPLYEHCCRALDRSLTRGEHGLPLMGTGDWNDGMNRVGRLGRGESVWLGFFLYDLLGRFISIASGRGDTPRASRYTEYREQLHHALETAGWDGAWYRRAYYDDGTPLGSAECDECRIDALAQAWAVISGAAPPERADMALDSLEEHLVSEEDGLIRLLSPAFESTDHDPGYIKGYVAGVRENGGQYTHAAIWVVRALAEAGRAELAVRLLEMLTPVHHARTRQDAEKYLVEPYVVAADVYGVEPHVGRGGWTWYTGSAGWLYRVAIESILGLRLADGRLELDPRISAGWPGYQITYRLPDRRTRYEIEVTNPQGRTTGITSGKVDGVPAVVEGGVLKIDLVRDGLLHRVEAVV